jgi:hypothetical protein
MLVPISSDQFIPNEKSRRQSSGLSDKPRLLCSLLANNPALLIGITVLGFLLPWFILKRMIRDRQNRIRLGLPNALDLTVISVEAGLSLDHASCASGKI